MPAPHLMRWDNRRVLPLAGFVSTGAVSLLAALQWVANPMETFGSAGWLWLLSMLLLVISAAAWPHSAMTPQVARPSAARAKEPIVGDAPVPAHIVEDIGSRQWMLWEVAAFAGIAALAVGLRLWQLADYPFAIHSDEIITGRVATADFGGPAQISIFSTTWYGMTFRPSGSKSYKPLWKPEATP